MSKGEITIKSVYSTSVYISVSQTKYLSQIHFIIDFNMYEGTSMGY